MPDTWELLLENSVAPLGSDAWTHLNSQEGVGGEVIVVEGRDEFLIELSGVDATLTSQEVELIAEASILTATVEIIEEESNVEGASSDLRINQ